MCCLYEVQNHTKKTIRERIVKLLRDQKGEERLSKSLVIGDKLFGMKEFRDARIILFYASFDGEVETFLMMKKAKKLGKIIALPQIAEKECTIVPRVVVSFDDDLESGPYGIKQPRVDRTKALDPKALDLVIVPAVAYDQKNNRLGRGGGYYDRFLKHLPPRVITVGLAFDVQLIDTVFPLEHHDIPVDQVITN